MFPVEEQEVKCKDINFLSASCLFSFMLSISLPVCVSVLRSGLQTSEGVHRYAGTAARNQKRLLEDDPAGKVSHHSDADAVQRAAEGQSTSCLLMGCFLSVNWLFPVC